MKKHIVSFSGGIFSTAMLLRMIELGYTIDEIIFADTGMEFDEMYQHISEVEEYIGRDVTVVKNDKNYLYWMFEHEKTRGKNKGKKGYMWMDFRSRWCTSQLKQIPVREYYRKLEKQGYEVIEYHGIAYDEIERTQNNKSNKREVRYPLVEWKWAEKDALQYCYDKGFFWNGLYEHFDRLSCYMCPLQRMSELEMVYRHYPKAWQHMKELDKRNIELYNRKFRDDYSVKQLEQRFDGKEVIPEQCDIINLQNMLNKDLDNKTKDSSFVRRLVRGHNKYHKLIYNNYPEMWNVMLAEDVKKIQNTKNGNPLRRDGVTMQEIDINMRNIFDKQCNL